MIYHTSRSANWRALLQRVALAAPVFLGCRPRNRSLRVLLEVGEVFHNELFLGGGKTAVVEPVAGCETVELIELCADFAVVLRLDAHEVSEDLGFAHRCGNR
jgi:hypothetical protein